tara:strand:+ start:4535 stop:4723 length:189 start_codon:yes stop_codon:yes gene_type:complete
MKVDMLINSHHRLTKEQHHAYQRASRKRIAKGKEADRIRKRMATALGRHINITKIEGGTIEE